MKLFGVQISMNHILLHSAVLIMLISHTGTFFNTEWAQISMNHTPNSIEHVFFVLRGSSHGCRSHGESPASDLEAAMPALDEEVW